MKTSDGYGLSVFANIDGNGVQEGGLSCYLCLLLFDGREIWIAKDLKRIIVCLYLLLLLLLLLFLR